MPIHNLEIRTNPRTNGFFCLFSHGDKKYIASIFQTPFEKCFTIFPRGGWSEIYSSTPNEISKEELLRQVHKFIGEE